MDDPRIDRCRGAVYQAEDSVAAIMSSPHRAVRLGSRVVTVPAELRFGTLEAVQRFADEVTTHPETLARYPGRGPVTVHARRGFRAATYQDGRIQVPSVDARGRWALARSVVLHECAHHLTGVPGHGPAFRSALLHLYGLHLGEGAAAMLAHLFAPIDATPDPTPPEGGARRVAALLAKAESTASPQEAEAYLAKAALVAQRHSIDLAVAAWSASGSPGTPTHRMLTIGQARAALNKHLVALLVTIAGAWSVQVDVGHGSSYVVLYGMAADLDQVESVFVTAGTLMVSRAQAHVVSGGWRGTTYVWPGPASESRPVTATVARNAFCLGFVHRLAQRLATARAGADASSGTDGWEAGGAPTAGSGNAQGAPLAADRVAVALRARDLAVSDYHRATTRARGRWRTSSSASATAVSSRRAGEQAAEEYGRQRVGRGRAAIGQ